MHLPRDPRRSFRRPAATRTYTPVIGPTTQDLARSGALDNASTEEVFLFDNVLVCVHGPGAR